MDQSTLLSWNISMQITLPTRSLPLSIRNMRLICMVLVRIPMVFVESLGLVGLFLSIVSTGYPAVDYTADMTVTDYLGHGDYNDWIYFVRATNSLGGLENL